MNKSDHKSNELPLTGKWYEVGRINVCTKAKQVIPWKSGTPIVISYDEILDELKMKPLRY